MGPKRLSLIRAMSVISIACTMTTACGAGDDAAVLVASDLAEVRSVSDGDTLRLTDGRRVRLLQIDAPEHGQCYAQQSTQALRRLMPRGQQIVLSPDPGLDDHDQYARVLRYVKLGGLDAPLDTTVNLDLVRQGAAVPYFFHGERGIYAYDLLSAAREASRERRGLWGACPGAKLDPNRGALTGPA